jgi:AcrR family transcriptional regulator
MSIKKSLPLRVKPAPRRRLTAANAKDTILDAAEAILNQEGPQGLKLADIAKGAKVTNGNVLHHFGKVEGVHDALMTRLVDRLIARILKIAQSPWTEDQRMTMSMREIFEAFEDKSTCRLAAWLVMTDRTKKLDEMRSAIERVHNEFSQLRAKSPRAAVPDVAIRTFMTLCIVNALGAGLFGNDLGRLMGLEDTAARDTALGALLTLAARDQTHQ